MIKAITFLGNPGNDYTQTRHNIGWMLLDASSNFHSLKWQQKFKGSYSQAQCSGKKIYLLKPETFMNKSGESVQAMKHFFKIEPLEILVVHDDLELEFGQISFKQSGGLAGHNGLRSIATALGVRNFHRFRLGISRPAHGNVSAYVLSKFSPDEQAVLPLILQKADAALESCLKNGIEFVEQHFAKKQVI